jgi:hypothetical protein
MYDESKIIELKRLTLEKDAKFSELAHYFFEVTEDPEFMKSGEKFHEDEEFFKVLLNPVVKYFGENLDVSAIHLIRIKKLGFVHGSAILSNAMLVAFYFFEEQQVGLAMAYFKGQTEFFRISAKTVPSYKVPIHSTHTQMH